MKIILVVAVIVAVWYWLHRRGNPEFWKFVRNRPDFALPWFESQESWIVIRSGDRLPSGDYSTAFRVADPDTGEIVNVHCLRDHIESSQHEFLEAFQRHRAREDRQSPLSLKLAPMSLVLGAATIPAEVRLRLASAPAAPSREAAINTLLDLVESQSVGKKVMARHTTNRQQLAQAFANLERHGAGVWIGDHYVAASAIAQVIVLDDVLKAEAEGDDWEKITERLVAYFRDQGAQLAWFGD